MTKIFLKSSFQKLIEPSKRVNMGESSFEERMKVSQIDFSSKIYSQMNILHPSCILIAFYTFSLNWDSYWISIN